MNIARMTDASAGALICVLAVAVCVGAGTAAAETVIPSTTASSGQPAAAVMSDGEVRKVDKEAGKVTLRHGPIASLDMPAMTMVFRVADSRMIESVKEGDKVRFTAARIDGAITLTKIEATR